jgi:hypothetical protein
VIGGPLGGLKEGPVDGGCWGVGDRHPIGGINGGPVGVLAHKNAFKQGHQAAGGQTTAVGGSSCRSVHQEAQRQKDAGQ